MTQLYHSDIVDGKQFISVGIYQEGDLIYSDEMDISDVRRLNLRRIRDELGSDTALSEKLDKGLSQIGQIIGTNFTRNIGTRLARQIEEKLGKPHGWLDAVEHQKQYNFDAWSVTSSLTETAPGKHIITKHPVVGTAQLGDNGYWAELDYPAGHGDGYIEYPATDEGTYALRCKGDSMAPRIQDGEFVLVSPTHQYINGDEVLIRCKAGRVMVKKYLYKRDGIIHLGSVNEAHPIIKIGEQDIDIIHYISGIARKNLWVPE